MFFFYHFSDSDEDTFESPDVLGSILKGIIIIMLLLVISSLIERLTSSRWTNVIFVLLLKKLTVFFKSLNLFAQYFLWVLFVGRENPSFL